MENQLNEQAATEVTEQEVSPEVANTTEVVKETTGFEFLDNVDEALLAEYKAMTHEQIIERMDKNQKELEQSLAEKNEAFEQLQQQMERTNFITTLADEGLSEFAGLFEITDVKEQVAFIKGAVNEILVKHSYQPKDVVKQEQYTQAIQAKDVESAIGFKFANFFKKN